MAILLITHDLGVIAETAHRVVVMYAGQDRRGGARSKELFAEPLHPYTQGLLRSIPRDRHAPRSRSSGSRSIPGVVPSLAPPARAGCRFAAALPVRAKADVHARRNPPLARSQAGPQGGVLAVLAGETTQWPSRCSASGTWSSTSRSRGASSRGSVGARPRGRRRLVRHRRRRDARPRRRVGLRQDRPPAGCILRLHRADRGRGLVRGARTSPPHGQAVAPGAPARPADHLPGPLRVAEPAHDRRRRSSARRSSSTARQEPAGARGEGRRTCSRRSASTRDHMRRYPHEFSGGQRQRIGIARALAVEPEAHRLRRAGLRARRLDPGAGDQPPRGPPGAVRPHLPLHRARPLGRRAHQRPGRGHVPRQDRRDRRRRRTSTSNPLHPYTEALLSAVPIPDPERQARSASCSRATCPSPIRPAAGLPLPHALPHPPGAGDLRGPGATAQAGSFRPPGGLPLPGLASPRARRVRCRRPAGPSPAPRQ